MLFFFFFFFKMISFPLRSLECFILLFRYVERSAPANRIAISDCYERSTWSCKSLLLYATSPSALTCVLASPPRLASPRLTARCAESRFRECILGRNLKIARARERDQNQERRDCNSERRVHGASLLLRSLLVVPRDGLDYNGDYLRL